MKYMITNGNEYISTVNSITTLPSDRAYTVVDQLAYAVKFKKLEAENFIKNTLGGDSKWGIRKVSSACSKRNYVITTGTNYVKNGTTDLITPDYSQAKWFKSVADADAYIMNHPKIFDNAIIIDQNGYKADAGEKRVFTSEQLEILGVSDTVTRHKRIVIPKTTREIVYENGKGVCAICGRPVEINNFTIDHIVPLARGGKNEVSNYQIACQDCNHLKGSRMDGEFMKSITTILSQQMLINPRQDLEDILIRTIVRGKINRMEESTYGA